MYAIRILESKNAEPISDTIVGRVGISGLFSELDRLFSYYKKQGGYCFSKHSIVVRLATMRNVLCWIAYSNESRFSCYADSISFPLLQGHLVQQDPVSNVQNDQ